MQHLDFIQRIDHGGRRLPGRPAYFSFVAVQVCVSWRSWRSAFSGVPVYRTIYVSRKCPYKPLCPLQSILFRRPPFISSNEKRRGHSKKSLDVALIMPFMAVVSGKPQTQPLSSTPAHPAGLVSHTDFCATTDSCGGVKYSRPRRESIAGTRWKATSLSTRRCKSSAAIQRLTW